MVVPTRLMWEETAWHLFFLPGVAASASSSSPSPSALSDAWKALLEGLDEVGYVRAGNFLEAFEASSAAASSDAEQSHNTSLETALQAALEVEQTTRSPLSWPQLFKSVCAASPYASLDDTCGAVSAQLSTCLRGTTAPSPSCFHHCGALRAALFTALAAHRLSADAHPHSQNETVFALLAPTDDVERAAFERDWLDARLYAALLMHQHHVCGRSAGGSVDVLARWIARYIYLKGTSSMSSKTASTATSLSGNAIKASVSGVVAGVLEYTLATTRTLPHHRNAVLRGWVRAVAAAAAAEDTTTSVKKEKKTARGASTPGVPCSVKEETISAFSAVLLAKLVCYCQLYDAECGPARAAAGGGAGDVDDAASSTSATAVFCGTQVVHCVQEILFGLVLGDSTRALPARPPPSVPMTAATTSKGNTRSGTHVLASLFSDGAGRLLPLVVTTRGLTLNEADAVVQLLFPSLLQQLGFEWPWSPLLRFLRQLGKHQRVPAVLAPPSSSAARTGRDGGSTTDEDDTHAPLLTVAWSSAAVLEAIFSALSRRTYPARLHNLLPGSYTPVLESLGLLPAASDATPTAGSGAEEGATRKKPLFELPLYYLAAGQALVEHFAECEGPGGRGVRAAETEEVLVRVTAALPVLVQLRARAANTQATAAANDDVSRGGENGVRGTLSADRVEALQCRYRAEVLLAAIVVHTQLETASHVEVLMRALSPLLNTLCTRMQQAGGGSFTMLVPATSGASSELDTAQHDTSSHSTTATGGAFTRLVFTSEAVALIDQVGYQFYPLEWLPTIAASYHQRQQQQQQQQESASSSVLPYSLWAAVAHQLAVDLRVGVAHANTHHASPSERASLPCGERAAVTLPSFSPSESGSAVRASLWEYVDGTIAAAAVRQVQQEHRTAQPGAAWMRAHRFFLTFMHAVAFLSSHHSSCDLEGTLAVAVTRRLGNNHSNTGGALSLMPPSSSPVVDRVRHFFRHSHVVEQLYVSVTDAEREERGETAGEWWRHDRHNAHTAGAKRARDGAAPPSSTSGLDVAAGSTDEHAQLAKLLLRDGATSFSDVFLEARDFLLALAGAFLPSTRVLTVAMQSCLRSMPLHRLGGSRRPPQEGVSESVSQTLSQRLLLSGWKWAAEAELGGAATADRVRVVQTLAQQQPADASASSFSSLRWWAALSTSFNSATIDAVPLARLVLRRAVARLVEKTAHRQHEARLLARALASDGGVDDADARDVEADGTCPDALLVHQWLEWCDLLPLLGLGVDEAALRATSSVHVRVSPWLWLWGSPFTSEANGW